MASSSEPARRSTERSFATRIVDWHWKWPVCLASALLLALLGIVFVFDSVLELHSSPGTGSDYGERGTHLRTHVVLSIVAAYTFGTGLIGLAMAARLLDRLRSVFRSGERVFIAYRNGLFPNTRRLAVAAATGGAVGAALDLTGYLARGSQLARHDFHSLPFMILLFALLGMMAAITIHQSRIFHEVGREHIDVDLLDEESLSPFGEIGLMNAAAWFIGSALASFLMVSAANAVIVSLVIVVTTALGFAALILPSRGLHLRLRELKREELTRIRNAIAVERATLFSDVDSPDMPPRMHSLLAYESRIQGVREWPFDTSTLSRFGLFLLIPLASWIGGALVERAVDAALG